MGTDKHRTPRTLLLQILDEGYQQKAWHGPNLKSSLRGVTAREAAWRPEPDRHNIWEIAVHAGYWKYVVRRRVLGEGRRGSFPLQGSNWFVRPGSAANVLEAAWQRDRAMLEEQHRNLVEAVSQARESTSLPVQMLFGVAFHDVYHAGQIQLLKRLLRRAGIKVRRLAPG
jgi:hypothetical protein